ncbi:MAG: helix-turn-helix domain-containing protein [Nocardia sp.]|nr:helix-turn-helix domain-containing protein [Nocardia sp.]
MLRANPFHSAVEAVSAALIGGQNPAALARAAGITTAERYLVLALSIAPEPVTVTPASEGYRTTRMRRTFEEACGPGTLALFGARGGTVLIPADERADTAPPELMSRLQCAARSPLSVVAVPGEIDRIPQTTHLAHELLDLVLRLRYPPTLYRFEDLTLEYQLTRPGPATEHLAGILEPIVRYPDLLHTLRKHIENNFHRQRTARALNIHSNTVDYRLRRIRELTGFDPCRLTDLWHLQSALVPTPAAGHTYDCRDRSPQK